MKHSIRSYQFSCSNYKGVTIILTDYWTEYNSITENGFKHITENP